MDLRSSQPFWLMRNGFIHDTPPLDRDETCEVLVVGGGITGALVADRLSHEGRDVIVIDRKQAGCGATAACTALILYETDVPLHRLVERVGDHNAERAYRLGMDAVRRIQTLCGEIHEATGDDCGCQSRDALWVAGTEGPEAIDRELTTRERLGFETDYLDTDGLFDICGIERSAALRTRPAAEVDPLRLTHRLLERVRQRGGRTYNHVEINPDQVKSDVTRVLTSTGALVRCRNVVIATGYEATTWVDEPGIDLYSTFAVVSQPGLELEPWHDRCVIWEAAEPYLYLRTTPDNRVILGGGDVPFTHGDIRDALLTKQTNKIIADQRRMMPWLVFEPEFAWAGLFGGTADGLPYIGRNPQYPSMYLAMGYGGNGITFSAIAADLIADDLANRPTPDANIFRFGR